jgi:structural maintenance of chromosome 3 (chondroitin sulfate proteoglycan 6)
VRLNDHFSEIFHKVVPNGFAELRLIKKE